MSLTTTFSNCGVAPVVAMGMTYTASAHSIGLLMENAVQHERNCQLSSQASIAQCLALILATGAAGATKGQ